jgi:hypothetical protein
MYYRSLLINCKCISTILKEGTCFVFHQERSVIRFVVHHTNDQYTLPSKYILRKIAIIPFHILFFSSHNRAPPPSPSPSSCRHRADLYLLSQPRPLPVLQHHGASSPTHNTTGALPSLQTTGQNPTSPTESRARVPVNRSTACTGAEDAKVHRGSPVMRMRTAVVVAPLPPVKNMMWTERWSSLAQREDQHHPRHIQRA